MKIKITSLLPRLLSGLVVIAFFAVLVICSKIITDTNFSFGSHLAVLGIIALLIWGIFFIASFEMYRLFKSSIREQGPIFISSNVLYLINVGFGYYFLISKFAPIPGITIGLIALDAVVLISIFGKILVGNRNQTNGFTLAIAITFINLAFLIFLDIMMRFSSSGFRDGRFPLFIFGLVVVCDVVAYVFGSLGGKSKIAPEISPNKTGIGLIISLLTSIIFAFVFLVVQTACGRTIFFNIQEISFSNIYGWQQFGGASLEAIVIGFILSSFACLGDLLFSFYKRQYHVKNYGKLLPGHGGILDRFDSLLATLVIAELVSLVTTTIGSL